MKKVFLIMVLVGLIVSSCKKKKEELVSPIMAPVTEAVFAPGYIEAENQYTLQAATDGYITGVPVKENDLVTANQVLFQLDNTDAAIKVQVTDSLLQITREQASDKSSLLLQLDEQRQLAMKKLQNNKIQLDRMERLYATGAVAKTDLEQAKILYESSISEVNGIAHTINSTKQNLQQSLITAKGEEQHAKENSRYYYIRALSKSRIFRLYKKKGELVRKGEPVAILGDPQRKIIVLNIDESSIAKISIGQKALLEMNTNKGSIYQAKVSGIYPAFDEATQSYKVELQVDAGIINAINGTMVQANIIVAHKEKVMLIPRASLGPDNHVRISRNKKVDTLSVVTGIVSNEWVEILAGLSLNDKITKHF